MIWSAPGKLFLFGEYAVLRGAPAVVTAVDRRVHVRPVEGPYRVVGAAPNQNLPSAVAAATDGEVSGWEVDVTQMFDGDAKLGLGSSAASCVALAAAMMGSADAEMVLPVAWKAHADFQHGKGSGGDIVASTFGGTQLVGSADSPRRLEWPADLFVRAVWTGKSADTRELVGAVLGSEEAALALDELDSLSRRAADAFAGGDVGALIDAAAEHDTIFHELGRAANVTLRTTEHVALARAARALGAAAKPSGAGGGDISLVFSADPIDEERLAALIPHPARLIDLRYDQPGLSVSN